MVQILEIINSVVWGLPTVVLILGTGLYFSLKTSFFQFSYFPKALKLFLSKFKPSAKVQDGVSPYQALCTALAATVGTGNIAGVAGAVALGGPGAVFWMWVCAFFGMVIKCAEAALAVRYSQRSETGETVGGPMYMIEKGLSGRWKPMAYLYAFFGVVAAFGVGNATQINAVLDGIHAAAAAMHISVNKNTDILIALGLAILIGIMLSGGAKQIGKIAEALVPYASVIYILLGLGVLVLRMDKIPNAFGSIFHGAFDSKAVTGGVIGSIFMSCRTGAARGVFTNEAGMGTASIAHAAAKVEHPVEQGLMGIMEVFIDTIVICTVTALVILCSDVQIIYGIDAGAWLTFEAFSSIYGGWSDILIAACLVLFALATVLGWGLYGLRCAQYLFGERVFPFFVVIQVITVLLGALLETGVVWLLAETVNGLMAIPNLITLILLGPVFFRLIKEYKSIR